MITINSIKSRVTKKKALMATVILLIAITAVSTYYLTRHNSPDNSPDYAVVLPQNRSVEDLGGWQRVSPPDSDPVYAYTDILDNVSISVSQQPIPDSFGSNIAAEVEQLAKSYNATTIIKAGDTPVYIGRSSKGPQSVIFARGDTLVLIKSQNSINQESWTNYIADLVDPKDQTIPSF